MSQKPPSSGNRTSKRPIHPFSWRRFTLAWKINTIFTFSIALLGSSIIVTILSLTGPALRNQHAHRAATVATNLGDAVAVSLTQNDPLELQAVVDKYAQLAGVAYVFVENGNGQLISHSLRAFPQELRKSRPLKLEASALPWRELVIQGRPVYETRAAVPNKVAVYVGFWADLVEADIQQTLFLLIGPIVLTLIVGLLLSLLLVRIVVRPIQRLADTANKISRGSLETPLAVDSQDEVGNLARSIDRLRASLKTAMARLTTG